ncbi:glycosyltransferase [Olsenella sp. YH-ols2217]|uniref:Glycosyltransferase n=1 Tax=Kribbibacterium absianum TaxID=3044210 RepID=A0ABT6ZM98_9ACTN|nr:MULTISPECIES: glycosyltransferase [unclassified Olsenella]MDJ1122164.1 glycosyltransferase [Olsenella sp. YH-ols2216]MDJ1130172.1 glycosyltransferase [Olsenella sp. YH-ols2217]
MEAAPAPRSYRHVILTRFNIPQNFANGRNPRVQALDARTDVPYLEGRFRLFEEFTFPSIAQQACQDFTWCVLFSDQTPLQFKERNAQLTERLPSYRPLYLTDDEAGHLDRYVDALLHEEPCAHVLTTRIDNDDAISCRFVADLHAYLDAEPPEKAVLSFPYGLQYAPAAKLVCQQHIFGNHFISFFEPLGLANRCILGFHHSFPPQDMERVALEEKGRPMWMEVVHGSNFANQLDVTPPHPVLDPSGLFDEFPITLEWGPADTAAAVASVAERLAAQGADAAVKTAQSGGRFLGRLLEPVASLFGKRYS